MNPLENTEQRQKEHAREEASIRTEYEKKRILSYDALRYNFIPWRADSYYSSLLQKRCETYKPKKVPSNNAARQKAHISIVQWIKSRFDPDDRKKVDEIIQLTLDRLRKETDDSNKREYERCKRVNTRIRKEVDEKFDRFLNGDPNEVQEYFSAVIRNDAYSLDNQQKYDVQFSLEYRVQEKRIIIDYCMPRPYDISNVKEWKIENGIHVIPKVMSKKEFLHLYEKILFDLVVRVTSLIFESDDKNIVSEVLFNASSIYDEVPDHFVFFLSVIIPKKNYIKQDIRNYAFVSKHFISEMKQAKYLDDIQNSNPPSILADKPPMKQVVPIETTLRA